MRVVLFVLVLGIAVVWGISKLTSGGRLIFVAPTDSSLGIVVDSRDPLLLPQGGFTDVFVSWGTHTVVTDSAVGKRTFTIKANLSDALLVPANERQCFVVIDVSEAYTESPGNKLPADWRPDAEALTSAVVVAPKHIWVTKAPPKISRVPGEPARILYPYDCEEGNASTAVDEWLGRTFGGMPVRPLKGKGRSVALLAPAVSLELKSEPPGAEVLIDGTVQPQLTPTTVLLAPGTSVLFRKEGFLPTTQLVPAVGPLSVTLSRAASLSITSTPPGASVSVDGREVGKTPLLTTVEPGLRTVTVSGPESLPAVRTVQVTLEKTFELEVALLPGARVDLLTSPQLSEFSLDGAALQQTRADIKVEAGRVHFLVLTARSRLPKWEVIGPFTAGAKESLVFELDDVSSEGLSACARQSEKNLQRLKVEQTKTQLLLTRLQHDGRDAAKVERKTRELQDELSARTRMRELCKR